MLKALSLFLVIYTFVALYARAVDNAKYSYRKSSSQTALIKILTIFLQPFMNVAGNRKVTHFWHFKNAEISQVSENIALPICSSSYQKRNFRSGFLSIARNALADLGWAHEAAIIKPVNYDGKWSLVFKDQYSGVCQESILLHEGSIKIIVDGNVKVWGKSEDETMIHLQLVEQINVNDKRDILFI